MGGILRIDPSAEKYRAAFLMAGANFNPNMYSQFHRYCRSLFTGMGRDDLVKELDTLIHEKIEKPMGVDIHRAQLIYKNMTALNSFTKTQSDFVDEFGSHIYKWQLQQWFEEIVDWAIGAIVSLEPDIRFSAEKPVL